MAQTVETVEPMAAQTPTVGPMAAQTAAPLAEESVLARLIAVDRDEFASVLGAATVAVTGRRSPPRVHQLLDANAIDELVSQRGLRTPFLRVAKNGTTLADKAFTRPAASAQE